MDQTTIPQTYHDILVNLFNMLEQETGQLYSLKVHRLGSYEPLDIKSFEKRSQYIVSDLKPKFEALGGTYTSVQEIRNKIRQLNFSGLEILDVDGEKRWKCPNGHYQRNYLDNHCCDDCNHVQWTDWHFVTVNCDLGQIFQSGGGRVTQLKPIGRLTIR